jgi:hypothetical protein
MSNFKIKKNIVKKKNIKGSNTLETKHLNNINKITKDKESLVELKKQLNETNNKLNKLDEFRDNSIIIDLNERTQLLEIKLELENKIKNINNNNDELNYYDLTSDLLIDYYNIRTNKHIEKKTINIMDILSKKSLNINKSTPKTHLFENYCQRVEGIKIYKDIGDNRIKYCELCTIECILDLNTSCYTCPTCGIMYFVIIDEDNLIKEYSPYQRKNHFKDWLKQFQAKEVIDISDEIFKQIIIELNKKKNLNKKKISRNMMQIILKNLGYSNLYKHIPFIINKVSGIHAPSLSKSVQDKLLKMFEEIQEPWKIYKPKDRKNFISYPYILTKFCELLELEDLTYYFPQLDYPNLVVPDQVWEKICNHLHWEFIPSQ